MPTMWFVFLITILALFSPIKQHHVYLFYDYFFPYQATSCGTQPTSTSSCRGRCGKTAALGNLTILYYTLHYRLQKKNHTLRSSAYYSLSNFLLAEHFCPGQCQCTDNCFSFGDCCSDYTSTCSAAKVH